MADTELNSKGALGQAFSDPETWNIADGAYRAYGPIRIAIVVFDI
jgi:hypothetical protein